MVPPWGRRILCVLVGPIVVAFIGAGCSGSDGGNAVGLVDEEPVPGTSSSPITADVPGDWQLVAAGVGVDEQTWGEDCCGSDEPYTVVTRSDDDRSVTVSATGYGAYQGGLAQAARGYLGEVDEFEVDGRRALLSTGSDTFGTRADMVDLVVDVDGSTAVRAEGVDASRDELVELAALAIVDDDERIAPRFERLPTGFELVGSVDGTGVLALRASLQPGGDFVPGDDRTHTLGWTVGPTEATLTDQLTVTVVAVPANTVSLDALTQTAPAQDSERTVEAIELGGLPGVEIDETSPGRWRQLTLVAESDWGDQLIVTTGPAEITGGPPTGFEVLHQVAGSVERADAETWDRLIEEASGGPGLTANVGRTEVTRGEAGGIEWLLQTGDGIDGGMGPPSLDGCLKLSSGDRACPMSGSATSAGGDQPTSGTAQGVLGPSELPFVIMSVPADDPAVQLRFTRGETTITAPFRPVPGTEAKASVLVAEQGDSLACPNPDQQGNPAPDAGVLERLDADGNTLACLE